MLRFDDCDDYDDTEPMVLGSVVYPWLTPPKEREFPIRFRYIGVERKSAEEEEEEPWPPVWKPVKECPQYGEGLLDLYLDEWDFEKYDHLHQFYRAFPFDHQNRSPMESHAIAKRFLQQVRESRGYDVDCSPPAFMQSSFIFISEEWMIEEGVQMGLKKKADFVISEINAQAERHCERYELLKVEKYVTAQASRNSLLTLRVRQVVPCANLHVLKTIQAMVNDYGYGFELMEWRFKPEEDSSSSDLFEEGSRSSY